MVKKTLFLIAALIGFITYLNAQQTARVQAIHNCPDPAASKVDVWLSNSMMPPQKVIDDFDYKEAIPFTDFPAGVTITLSVTGQNSTDTSGAVFHKDFTLAPNSKKIIVASGGLAETGSTAFDLRVYDGMEMASYLSSNEVSIKVIHGAYDAPVVDVYEVQQDDGMIADDIAFGDEAGYLDTDAADYDLQLRDQTGSAIKEFDADVSTFADSAMAILATGYADTAAAVGSEPLGLMVVFPNGTVSQLSEKNITPANVQVIHACPDPSANTVDVWVSDGNSQPQKEIANFSYKEATPYLDLPTDKNLTFSVTPPSSTDTSGAVFHKTFNLQSNDKLTVVANGGLAETGNTAFDLRVYEGMKMAEIPGNVSLNVIHSSYDAPEVDIWEVQNLDSELVPDISFAEESSYADISAMDYDIQVRLQNGMVFKETDADLSTYMDSAITVLATGYADTVSAVGSEPFELIAVFPDGTVATLPEKQITPAKLQVIHNSAATDADSVDIWLNDNLLLDNFHFRTATPFVDAPAGDYFDVSVALPSSTDTASALYKESFMLQSNKKYIVIASGNVGSGTYNPAEPFDLVAIPNAQKTSMNPGMVDLMIYHGSTDAPAVDIDQITTPFNNLTTGLSYGNWDGYTEVAAADHEIEISASGSAVAQYSVPLQTLNLADSALTVLASGYLDPSVNNNGPAFGLWVALPSGGDLVELPVITNVKKAEVAEKVSIYPNPAVNEINIRLENKYEKVERVEVFNNLGQVVKSENIESENDPLINIKINDMPKGQYFVNIQTSNRAQTFSFVKSE